MDIKVEVFYGKVEPHLLELDNGDYDLLIIDFDVIDVPGYLVVIIYEVFRVFFNHLPFFIKNRWKNRKKLENYTVVFRNRESSFLSISRQISFALRTRECLMSSKVLHIWTFLLKILEKTSFFDKFHLEITKKHHFEYSSPRISAVPLFF